MEGELYRGIAPHRADFYRGLFESGIVRRLIVTGDLVTTDLTDLQLDGYALVLKHRRLRFVSYPFCWSGTMLTDAALLTLDLDIELARSGLMLQDAHPFNVLFDGSRPQFVDFTGIVPAGERPLWAVDEQFRSTLGLCNRAIEPATKRFRCDMVLALDLIPELIFKRDLNSDQVVEALAQFTERWLLLEFVPWEDPDVRRLRPDENPFFPRGFYDWYSLDSFTRALARHFTTVESMPSDPKGRVLLLCER